MLSPQLRSFFLASSAAFALVACSSSGSNGGPSFLSNVGRIPGVGGQSNAVVVNGVRANLSPLDGVRIGALAQGNRLLVIGDSILAGTSSRYGGALCSELVPLGWRVAVEAEAGQMVGFGRTVLQKRLVEGWDAAVVFLGTNFGGDAQRYQNDLEKIVSSLSPRPTLLLTASLFRPTMQEVNQVIRIVAAKNTNVSVLDWSSTSAQPGLLNNDKVHPTDTGRQVLIASIASALGSSPSGQGACLASLFKDDSLVLDVMPSTSLPGETVSPETIILSTPSSTVTTIAPPTTMATTVTTAVVPTTTISRSSTTVIAG